MTGLNESTSKCIINRKHEFPLIKKHFALRIMYIHLMKNINYP